ncbi:MAG: polyprenyl synthetase family protein [Deltaproteobacteria bacterium]|jgi:geranylgeranyl pyrophosphate synthase|nr:polyprenyl synthetase family protein [Deltaproteobacteria bacterium]
MSDQFLASLGPLIARINQKLREELAESNVFPAQVGLYGLGSGGKRIRPAIFCLMAAVLGRKTDEEVLRQSTSFEFLHLATLYHDDIVDKSDTRRGQPAAHRAFGVPEALLAADYLLAKSAEVSLATKNMDCFNIFIRIIKELSLGELEQLKNQDNGDLPLVEYEKTIYRKTAVLIEGVGLIVGQWLGASAAEVAALGEFGRLLGLAFQITDDLLDYEGAPLDLGKPIGQDLDEGRVTIPFILARDRLGPTERGRLVALGQKVRRDPSLKEEIIGLVTKGQGLALARALALDLAKKANETLKVFPRKAAREKLIKLNEALVQRDK